MTDWTITSCALCSQNCGLLVQVEDEELVRVVTAAGEVEVELEVTAETRAGLALMPHGFGLKHAGEVYGANVNHLTHREHRDRLVGTPIHRFVPCRVERLTP